MTKSQALKIYHSEIWKDMTDKQICDLQLFEDRLCVDWSVFRRSLNKCLGRPVFTHELINKKEIIKEYLGKRRAPTFEEILSISGRDVYLVTLKDK